MRGGQKNKPDSTSRIRLEAGFSLIEMLVVMAIAAILLTTAMPSFGIFFNKEKIATYSEEFESALAAVRSSAIKSGVPVVLCASTDGSSCGESWSDGWFAFKDDNRDGVLDATETTVLMHANRSSATELTVKSSTGDNVEVVSFNYRGAPSTALSISVSRGGQDRSMTVTPFGKLRYEQ